jgi:phosphatidylglycerol:prolipoprotein diacylglycerol transferase
MRRTLILIPHEIFSLPVFGLGWLLALVGVAAIVIFAWNARRGVGFFEYWSRNGVFWGFLFAIILWGIPLAELRNLNGDPVGIPIRGYGAMLLCGVVAAVWLAIVRAKRYGVQEQVIWGIAPWAIAGGLLGARAFYVIEYRDQFIGSDPLTTLRQILNFSEGGLVVYGAFIGGFVGALIYVLRNNLSVLEIGDVIIPTLFIGLALGRIGCLLNGCCYGALCGETWYAIRFPNGSPVYQEQLASGRLVGLELSENHGRVMSVRSGSLADDAGVSVNQAVSRIEILRSVEFHDPSRPAEEIPLGLISQISGRDHYWSAGALPPMSDPVLPTQIISALGGLLLCLSLCFVSRHVERKGMIMFGGIIGYAVLRFLLETLRNDEPGQFGTELTIAQWVSLFVLVLGTLWLIAVLYSQFKKNSTC